MHSVSRYTPEYVAQCRSALAAQVAAYRELVAAAGAAEPEPEPNLQSAVDGFERLFFRDLIVALEKAFVHRDRAREGRDGNAANEVRMLAASILTNGGFLAADEAIRYDAKRAVLGVRIGGEIDVDAAGFSRLLEAFLGVVEAKYR